MEDKEARKAAMLDASLDAIITIDHNGCIVEFNRAAQETFGYTQSEVVGRDMAEVIIPARLREAHRTALARVVDGATPRLIDHRIEMPALRRDGSEFPVELAITKIEVDGAPMLFTGFLRDITRQKSAEESLRDADRQKDEFLAMLGHELRNPLAAVQSATELLKLTCQEDPAVARIQRVLQRQTDHMAKLLDDLLDVSRIIHSKIKLRMEVVDLAATCDQVISGLSDQMTQRDLDFHMEMPSEPIPVKGDPVRLAQIVGNLMSNALKYTPVGGSIKLSLQREGDMAVLVVRDTGVGIDPDLLPHIFSPFRQAQQDLDRSQGGLGLGLALVRSLVELQEGRVEAASGGSGKGSEFVVRLPITAQPVSAPDPSEQARYEPMHILLIEDHADAAEMLRQALEYAGHKVALAPEGRQGVAQAVALTPDLILCDLGLPGGMSGYDVARELRADARTADICLVALSGYGRDEDKSRATQAGFDTHITKPVDVSTVHRLLAQLQRRQAGGTGAEG